MSATFVTLLAFLPIGLTAVKVLVDGALFFLSYFVQKRWVFRKPAPRREPIV